MSPKYVLNIYEKLNEFQTHQHCLPKKHMKPFSLILLPNGTTQEQNENLLDRYILSSSQSHKLPLSCVILTLQLSLETMQAILIGGQYQNIDLPMMLPIFLT